MRGPHSGSELRPKDIPKDIRERLTETAVERLPTGCLVWTKAKFKSGYGMVWLPNPLGGRPYGTHRLAYVIHHGILKASVVVRHECDVKLCVEGKHLLGGTQKQNIQEYWLRQTEIGERASSIRRCFAKGVQVEDLVSKLGIERETVILILKNRKFHDPEYTAPSLESRDPRLKRSRLKLDRDVLLYAKDERTKGRAYSAIATELGVAYSTLWEAINGRSARRPMT